MKKKRVLMLVFLGLFILTGCQSTKSTNSIVKQDSSEQAAGATVRIELKDSGEMISSKEVQYSSDETLLQVLKENFKVEEKDGFIQSIEGHDQDESTNKYWTFTINEKMGEKGANEIKLKNKDQVEFDLSTY
ncbi:MULTISPECIES: DUF4430 domain-containing protein [Enterococcus]|uniref:DUF4430 domain-containing protein n=1 Tax=Enterococcus asini TaxID=57732 RepID=A0AAW8TYR5_9ENTE|nr:MULTISPECIES: DUF4430 domain-containing protein [Enterococcus]MCD5030301.1 DUF4430 domain-containing protein [Enterococcus asini]MDT2810601.1 DUF4430 domain-containing protein [Enterococcus asini]